MSAVPGRRGDPPEAAPIPAAFLAAAILATAFLAMALFAAACAAPLRLEASADPLGVLSPGALAYARLSGPAARELAPSVLPQSEAKALAPLLARTRLVAIGLGGSIAPEGADRAPSLQACLVGDYPFRAASISLGSDPAWKREKEGYYNARLGLRAALPGPSLVLASSGPLGPLLAGARAPGPSPIPERLAALASGELLLWAPQPFAGAFAALLGEEMDVPALGLLISATPMAVDYAVTVTFLMADRDSARIFRPALRLAWYGLARGLLGEEAEGALDAAFALEGEVYAASGIRLSGKALARALGSLRDGLEGR